MFLEPKGASTPVLWLVSELNKVHAFNRQPDLGSALEGLVNDKPIASLATPSPGVFDLSQPKGLLLGTLAGCGGLAAIAALVLGVGLQKPLQSDATPKQRVERYEAILKKEPTNLEALKQLGNAYSDLQQHEQAIQSYEKVLSQDPNDLQALDGLAFLYGLANRKPQQEEMYDRILKISPDNLIALTEKAGLLIDKGDRKGAEKLFLKAENVSPDEKLKQTIRDIADKKLKNSTKPASDAKP
jgi:Tetratricopeptide repeat